MKKLILLLTITCISITVFSQWSHVGTNTAISSLKGYRQIDYKDNQTIAAIIYREDMDDNWYDFFAVSTNFGATWTFQQIYDELFLNSLSYIKNTNIIYLSSNKRLYKSVNNGTTWDSIQYNVEGLTLRPELSWIKYRTETEGYAFVENTQTVYKTLDGGLTWNSLLVCEEDYSRFVNFINDIMIINSSDKVYFYNLTTNDVRTETLNGYVDDIDFVTEMHGFIVGDINYDGEFETKDGGVTWNQMNYPDITSFWAISNIAFCNENDGIMVKDNAYYYMTNNGGETWVPIEKELGWFDDELPYTSLEMINPTTAIGLDGFESGVWVTKTLDITAGTTFGIDVPGYTNPSVSVNIVDNAIHFSSSVNMENLKFEVYSAVGNLIYESTINNYQANNELIKEITNISNGILILKVHSNNMSKAFKFKN